MKLILLLIKLAIEKLDNLLYAGAFETFFF